MAQPGAVEWLAKSADVQVRVMTLAPGQGTAWHFHRAVTDFVFALDDGIEVQLRAPDSVARLAPGERHDTPPLRVHRVFNVATTPGRYLLVQGTGTYDFVEVGA